MHGTSTITFLSLFVDTLVTHGLTWTLAHYRKASLPEWEARFWLRAAWSQRAMIEG